MTCPMCQDRDEQPFLDYDDYEQEGWFTWDWARVAQSIRKYVSDPYELHDETARLNPRGLTEEEREQ